MKKTTAAGIIAYVLLFLILANYDLSFSTYLTGEKIGWFTGWGEKIGLLPGSLIFTYCCAVKAFRTEESPRQLYLAAGWTGAAIGLYHICQPEALLCVPLGGALLWGMYEAGKKSRLTDEVLKAGVIMAPASVIAVNVLKIIWGRPRFYSLSLPGQSFHRWYVISGPAWLEDMNKSFPSGHTASSAVILWTQLLKGKHRHLVTAGAVAWIILTGLARIMAGMHYISDTMAGAGISAAVYFVVRSKIFNTEVNRKKDV